jgi:hypothetical protein
MKKIILFFCCSIVTQISFGQNRPPKEYSDFIKKADSLYNVKQFKAAAMTYTLAFKTLGGKGIVDDRYNAACSWALAEYPDSAFFQLDKIVTNAKYSDYNHITNDPDLKSLYKDKRWDPLLERIKANKDKAEANLNKPLVYKLDSIFDDDQKYRLRIDEIEKKFGRESKEMNALWDTIREKDAINLIKVKSILDKYGWLGKDVIGVKGNSTLFLVIQHSDQTTQEKYLPMMRESVKNGKASASSLALLEDRVLLGQGKKQIYGSQISFDPEKNLYYVRPLEDPDNVDKRRAEVGLQPLSDYVKQWNIIWDVEQYKKDLPTIEDKWEKRYKK